MTWRAFPATEGDTPPGEGKTITMEERRALGIPDDAKLTHLATIRPKRKYIDLDTMGRGYKPEMTVDELTAAARRLFQQVGGELPLEKEDTSDDAFIDFIGDRLCDFGVPMPIIDEVIVKLGGKP